MYMTKIPGAQDRGPAVAILAGGQSRRMGSDKAQLLWNGVSWLEHTAHVGLEVASRVVVIGRRRPLNWALESVVFLEDSLPNIGPLGGLFTALSWLEHQQDHQPKPQSQKPENDALLLLACDMPLLQPKGLHWLIEQWILKSAGCRKFPHGMAVKNDGCFEPLFSVYSLACLPLIEARLEQGRADPSMTAHRFSLHEFIESADFEYLVAPPAIAAMLRNLNTPQDIDAATQDGSATDHERFQTQKTGIG